MRESSRQTAAVDHSSSILEIILASRSPRRRELLALLVPAEAIRVMPPANADEAGFHGLNSLAEIERQLLSIATAKRDDVLNQLGEERSRCCVIAADTVVVVGEQDGARQVLGQPPERDWQSTARRWFLEHYAGRTHLVLTGLSVAAPHRQIERIIASRVTFRSDVEVDLDWYLATGEPQGKAGGYAIQGLGSLFVERVEGSLTNVVGLPLEELRRILCDLRVD